MMLLPFMSRVYFTVDKSDLSFVVSARSDVKESDAA